MTFKWNDYLDLATTLETSNDEAAKRSAVSRSYYALYNQAMEWFRSDPVRRQIGLNQDERSHDKLWSEMLKCGNVARKIANTGQMLRKSRNECDYHRPLKSNASVAAKTALGLARSSIEDIKKI